MTDDPRSLTPTPEIGGARKGFYPRCNITSCARPRHGNAPSPAKYDKFYNEGGISLRRLRHAAGFYSTGQV